MPAKPEVKQKISISDAWGETLRALDLYYHKIKDYCLDDIAHGLMIKVLYFVSNENRLTMYDEKIFDYYKHLMWYYYQSIRLYRENNEYITDSRIRDILGGICSVLSSQIRQFEEYQHKEYTWEDVERAKNPIKQEKMVLLGEINEGLANEFKQLKLMSKKDPAVLDKTQARSLIFSVQDPKENYVTLSGYIYTQVLEQLNFGIYRGYQRAVSDCAAKINNLQMRRAAGFYYDAIKAEKENLESIIKIQVSALEREMKGKLAPPAEEQAVQQILGALREAYQHLGKEIEELVGFFKEAETSAKEPSYQPMDELVEDLKTRSKNKYIHKLQESTEIPKTILNYMEDWKTAWKIFTQTLDEFAQQSVTGYLTQEARFTETLEGMRLDAADKYGMAGEMIDTFCLLTTYFKDNREALVSDGNAPIITGIQETLEIKLDTIKENAAIFLKDTVETLEKNLSGGLEIDADSLAPVSKALREKWLDHFIGLKFPLDMDEFQESLDSLLSEIPSMEGMMDYQSRMKRKADTIKTGVAKKINDFMKNHLLFEITTYEEIVNYSVAKLRESQNPVIAAYVQKTQMVSEGLMEILRHHGIEKIAPQRGDWFNGKEHEVLMAEKEEGLEKGQVVKLMNSGFKYQDTVVLRANVIAAR